MLAFVNGLVVHFHIVKKFYNTNSYYDIKSYVKSNPFLLKDKEVVPINRKIIKITSSGFVAKSSTRNNTCCKKCNKKLAKKKPMIIMLMINRLIILGLLKCSVNDFLSLVCMFSSFP